MGLSIIKHDIISVRPTEQMFSITWMLGSLCNYDCMYCSPEWHDTHSRPHDLEDLKQAWQNVVQASRHLDLAYKISFTGGEVTANRSFLPFVTWLREQFDSVRMISITTNGSASLNYYEKLAKKVEAISFSTHSEFMDEAEFFSKAQAIDRLMTRPTKSFHVNIMHEPWHAERIQDYVRFCQRHSISHSVNSIDMRYRVRDAHAILPEKNLERLG